MDRDLEHDIKALADRARDDREFAVELYGALCNAAWRHDDGTEWPGGTWRYVADVVAHLRGRGEEYVDFYCSGGEGAITNRVAEAMAAIGWHGVGHGVRLRAFDPISGEVDVLSDDGQWVVERRGADELPPAESQRSLIEIADRDRAEDWKDRADRPNGQER